MTSFMLSTSTLSGLGYDCYGRNEDLLCEMDKEKLANGEFLKASADTICLKCGEKYWRHPKVQGALWLHRICDNKLVQL